GGLRAVFLHGAHRDEADGLGAERLFRFLPRHPFQIHFFHWATFLPPMNEGDSGRPAAMPTASLSVPLPVQLLRAVVTPAGDDGTHSLQPFRLEARDDDPFLFGHASHHRAPRVVDHGTAESPARAPPR